MDPSSTPNNYIPQNDDPEDGLNLEHHCANDSPRKVPMSHLYQSPRLYLVIVNIGKFQNVWSMVHAGIAFGCTKILVVGQANNYQRLLERAGGNIPELQRFDSWKECVEFMHSKNIHLIGVEIDECSKLFNDEYFEKYVPQTNDDIGILLGNEGQGILPKFQKECHSLIRIPQFGSGTASLNVNVACNIVLHRFSIWKQERPKQTSSEKQNPWTTSSCQKSQQGEV
ncbi:RNA methyltransferase, TrmH family, group 3 [Nitzschia inconspicua]|uniref:RNA methyltransferase, TrmH family, group 3 n=1 Tax=Nitzschia inconspicua TaxID=303405 RepID=A0A9K3K4U4_9STRA|nr:RNA methyltransferase, TrmH family, group 3 [Nitzschia inconspicua]KAG7337043.1 RNA methyltransferase, TrmH family, group 3 [Nitzschia inconspicua]